MNIQPHTKKWVSFLTEQLTHTWEDHADVNPNDKIYYWVNQQQPTEPTEGGSVTSQRRDIHVAPLDAWGVNTQYIQSM